MNERTRDIIRFARGIREYYNTRNPEEISRIFGVEIVRHENLRMSLKAYVIRQEGFPTIISINEKYSGAAWEVLCAHELGHALMHEDGFNSFAITSKNMSKQVEYEADLFALALLFDQEDFNLPFEEMSAYMIKSVLDLNIDG